MADAFDRLKAQILNDLKSILNGEDQIQVPDAARLIWQWFDSLHGARSWGMNAPNPISYQEIEAYCRVMRWPLRPHEVQTIREMDQVYINHWYSQQNNGSANLPTLPRSSGAAINPDVFDAVFG